jgi:hypothetical protein
LPPQTTIFPPQTPQNRSDENRYMVSLEKMLERAVESASFRRSQIASAATSRGEESGDGPATTVTSSLGGRT